MKKVALASVASVASVLTIASTHASGSLFDTVNNVTGAGITGTDTLLEGEVGSVITFLIGFTILGVVIYRLNKIFGWFGGGSK